MINTTLTQPHVQASVGVQVGAGLRAFKRLLDVLVAMVGFVIAAPVLVVCALYVWLRNPGPVLYRQWRVGKDGRLFRIFKLRTMRLNAEHQTGAVCADKTDNRIIPGCRWMRRSHVDELPQIWNILCGDMSVVGPRPERPEIIDRIAEQLPEFQSRLVVKPGLTGLAQVRNGYTNDLAGLRRKLDYDLQYIRRMTWLQDLKLILQTIPKVWDDAAH